MMNNNTLNSVFFTKFKADIKKIAPPEKFTYPFYYEPHELSKIAAEELQQYLLEQQEWEHNFGLKEGQDGLVIGKMFGVLIVENQEGELGYLAAFSGKMAGKNIHHRFVPPVFDMLKENSFFLRNEAIINDYNQRIQILENDKNFNLLLAEFEQCQKDAETAIFNKKKELKIAKSARKKQREASKNLNKEDYLLLQEDLIKQSLRDKHELKVLTDQWKARNNELLNEINTYTEAITQLKEERKSKSAELQEQLFEQYSFLNRFGESKNLLQIFRDDLQQNPPSAAGECAAPKLLQYAFLHQLKPIAMAEFWWGQSPKSAVRKHKNYYPACIGKCKPILGHMLKGIEVENNPMLENSAEGKNTEIIYEDNDIAVVNKPAEFLSVPGIHVTDSVYERMKKRYPDASGPLIVHRLDMSTSGILLIAKNKETHKFLQSQFIKKTISKRYLALLNGIIEEDEGEINLPLRVDLDDRPRQLVCYEYGKPAQTKWKVISRENKKTRIHFFPITGRTHQLRVHASHPLGLNTAIVGDDLYGTKDSRLHLHAEWISFIHPKTNKRIEFSAQCDF